jgi:hypothetical protein
MRPNYSKGGEPPGRKERMKEYYEINQWTAYADEDVWKDGCAYNGKHNTKYGRESFKGATPDDAIRAFVEFVGADDDCVERAACDEESRVDISVMENSEGYRATEGEISLWKAGRCRLWYCVYTGYVEKVTREEVSLVAELV